MGLPCFSIHSFVDSPAFSYVSWGHSPCDSIAMHARRPMSAGRDGLTFSPSSPFPLPVSLELDTV